MVACFFYDCFYILESIIIFFFSLYFLNVKYLSTNMLLEIMWFNFESRKYRIYDALQSSFQVFVKRKKLFSPF